MKKTYNSKKIEAKWQKIWEKKKLFLTKDKSKKPKFYGLIEFPYPSGEGLHVGHIRSYTAMDIVSRKRRMEGFNVLYPIGWDAFGLPTENFAIKTGIQPKIVTKKNTGTFRKQLKSLGFSFDWSREINTSDPAYYKWTQWIFLQMFKAGLAYKKKMAINWCPNDKIGLANEEVIDGKCERCGTTVEKREKEQWMLAITKYADRLDKDLDTVDYLEKIKIQQRNWIGKSEGSEIEFKLDIPKRALPKKILIGTRNPAKVRMVKEAFPKSLGIEFVSLDDILKIDEKEPREGNDFRENARRKSEFFFRETGIPTISTDHILWVDKYPQDKGFIVHVRKVANPNSPRATDDEVGKWIERFVDEHGESKAAFYYGVSFTDKEGTVDFSIKQREYLLQKSKSPIKNEGYVFDRYLKDLETGEFRVEQQFEKGFGFFNEFINNEFLSIFSEQKIKVFTTRADTLFGATYLVLAPEHSAIENLRSKIENWDEVKKYIENSKSKTDIIRTAADKEKTGVRLKGISATNPANGEKIPVWIADYVLTDYGTGAIMAVPAHDERDFAFAKKYDLPFKEVIEPLYVSRSGSNKVREDLPLVPRQAISAIVKHWSENKYLVLKWKRVDWTTFVTGGVEKGQTPEEAALSEIREETGYQNLKLIRHLGRQHDKFYHVPKKENRFAHFDSFYFILENGEKKEVSAEEQEKHEVIWLSPDKLPGILTPEGQRRDWELVQKGQVPYTGDGILVNSSNPKIFVYTEGKEAWRANEPEVVRPTVICIIKHWSENKFLFLKKKMDGKLVAVAGGTDGEDLETAGKREIREETGYLNAKFVKPLGEAVPYRFYSSHGKQNRKSMLTPAYFELINGDKEEITEEEKSLHDLVWLSEEKIGEFLDGRPFNSIFWNRFKGTPDSESGNFNGMDSVTARKAITDFVGGKSVSTYKLRDWIFSRQRYWGEPIPLVYCENCSSKSSSIKNCIILHGCPSKKEDMIDIRRMNAKHWIPWLKLELEKKEVPTETPLMPTPWAPDYQTWKNEFEKFKIDDNTILVGHSCGCTFLLRWLGETKRKIGKLVLVAPQSLVNKKWRDLEDWKDFIVDKTIKHRVGEIVIFSADNEEEKRKKTSKFLKKQLGARLIELGGKGHYTYGDLGGQACPELLPEIADSNINSGWVAVPDKDLPVKLPEVKNYKPTDTGESPLATVTKWVNTKCPKCGGPARRETDTMPNWAGSSWYYLRYIDPKNKKTFGDEKKLQYWSGSDFVKLKANSPQLTAGPVDWYNGGMEHTTLHLLYSRFWHKFLYEQKLVLTSEPYAKRTSHGLILAGGGVKMSKSKGNVINPDDLVKRFGADALRLYEMFIGPFDQAVSWSEDGIVGTYRFLERAWNLKGKIINVNIKVKNEGLEVELHKTIKKVSEDIENMKFNTAVSQLMIFTNECEREDRLAKETYETLLKLLAPFAPHIAEELWEEIGGKKSIHFEKWPKADERAVRDSQVKIAIQINGKVRADLEISTDAGEQETVSKALSLPTVKKWLDGQEPKKIIFVKGKIVSIVA